MSEDQKDVQNNPAASDAKSAENASEKVAETPADKPADKTGAPPLAKADTPETDKAADSPAEKPAEKAVEKPADSPAAKTDATAKADAPAAEKAAETPEEKPAAKPAPKADGAAEEKPAAAAKPAAKPAAAKKAPPPPDPRAVAAKETADRIKAAIVAELGEKAVEETGAAHFNPMVLIRKEDWARAVDVLRTHTAWRLNYVELMAGTDYPNYIEVVIYVQSTDLKHFVCLKTRTDREKAEVPSLSIIFPGVNWEEREIYDLLGVTFTNHPDLRRIMMWDEFKGHPLRKDYSVWD